MSFFSSIYRLKSSPNLYKAVIGDSKLLAVCLETGELARLFWPNVDYGQHVESFRVGVAVRGALKAVRWLDENGWTHAQRYLDRTNVLVTTSEHRRAGLALETAAFALAGRDALAFRYRLTNRGARPRGLGLMLYQEIRINESPFNNTGYYDEEREALVFYMRDTALATVSPRAADGFDVGVAHSPTSALRAARFDRLGGNPISHFQPDGALRWQFGELAAGEAAELTVFVLFAGSLAGALDRARQLRALDAAALQAEAEAEGRGWLDAVERAGPSISAPRTAGKADRLRRLYDRSLLAIKLLADRQTGAIIAAPEFDREREKCGGYGYTWGRDGALIAYALGRAGCLAEAEAFYHYARRVQEPSGVWLHRHYATGELAPSWGLVQIDETGAILWSMAEHHRRTRSRQFLLEMWEAVERGADFLSTFLDGETGLPRPSYDLWEEYEGTSIYAAAAVQAGFAGAARIASALRKGAEARAWSRLAGQVREAINLHMWDARRRVYYCALNRRVTAQQFKAQSADDPENFYVLREPGRLYETYVKRYERRIDSSMLGLVAPYGVFEARDARMKNTARAVAGRLWAEPTGGIRRYEGDEYVGGNPWILTTLWLALYHIAAGGRGRAGRLIRWAADHATGLDLLTEQVDQTTGEPVWAVPLAWSHAMFILSLLDLNGAAE